MRVQLSSHPELFYTQMRVLKGLLRRISGVCVRTLPLDASPLQDEDTFYFSFPPPKRSSRMRFSHNDSLMKKELGSFVIPPEGREDLSSGHTFEP